MNTSMKIGGRNNSAAEHYNSVLDKSNVYPKQSGGVSLPRHKHHRFFPLER